MPSFEASKAGDATPAPLSASRIPQLDGIRGLAILLVLLWHYVAIKLDPAASSPLGLIARTLGLSWTGVDLFFVLSGFLIGGILLDNRDAPHYFRAFYARRVARIFPLYYSWLVLFLAATSFLPAPGPGTPFGTLLGDPLPLWSYATYTQNITMVVRNTYGPEWLGVTWSLAIEEQFYAFIPLIIRLIPVRRLPFILFLGVTAAPLLRVLTFFIPGYNALFNHVLMPMRADALLLGVLVAILVRKPSAVSWLGHHRHSIYAGLAILLAGACVLSAWFNTPRSFIMASLGYSWIALLYATLLLLAVLEPAGPIARFTCNRWLRELGILAYGIYLIHQVVNIAAHSMLLNQWPQLASPVDALVTVVALVLTVGIARLSWIYFEKPILKRGQQVTYGDPDEMGTQPAASLTANPLA